MEAPHIAANIGYGQAISLCMALALLLTQSLSRNNMSSPALQAIFIYALLSIVFASMFYLRRLDSVQLPWWFWWILGFLDAQANYCCVLAHRGNVNFALLGGILHMTVPFVMVLSFLVLHRRYMLPHLLGAFVAFVGCLLSYFMNNPIHEYSDQGKGNFWALLAAFFYAISILMSEYAVKRGGFDANVECLGKMGLVGCLVLGLQLALFERDTMSSLNWTEVNILYLFGYTFTMFVFYFMVNIFLRYTDSLMMSLSIQTSDIYNTFFNYICFSQSVDVIYWIALGLNYTGIIIYSSSEPPFDDGDAFGELGTPPLDKIEICATP